MVDISMGKRSLDDMMTNEDEKNGDAMVSLVVPHVDRQCCQVSMPLAFGRSSSSL